MLDLSWIDPSTSGQYSFQLLAVKRDLAEMKNGLAGIGILIRQPIDQTFFLNGVGDNVNGIGRVMGIRTVAEYAHWNESQ